MKNIVFLANSRKRFRYFSLIAEKMSDSSKVIFAAYPSWAYFAGLIKRPPISKAALMDSHMRRQAINYPSLTKNPYIWGAYCFLSYLNECCRFYHYAHIMARLNTDTVAIWNGQKQPYFTMVKAAEFLKKRIVFFENGLLPNTTTADFSGVNAENCLPKQADFYKKLDSPQQSLLLPDQLVIRAPHKKRQLTGDSPKSLPERYFFVPFQVPGDSQIVINSPWVSSMEQFYYLLKKAHKQLRDQGQVDVPHLVFKEHPSYAGRFEGLYDIDEFCLFANENNTQELIENAQAVITINSTVGIESLLLGKKVMTLGDACYNIEGLVLHADSEVNAMALFAQLVNWQPDETLRLQFLHFLNNIYAIAGGWEEVLVNGDDKHIEAVIKRIYETDTLAEKLSNA